MTFVRRFCCVLWFVAVGVPSLDCASSKDEKPGLSGLECYLLQMHIHGHSNHNGNTLPASMESHVFEAEKHGFDVIWWTDHARLFEPYDEDITIDFTGAQVDESSRSVIFGEARARQLDRLFVDRPARGSGITVAGGRLLVDLESPSGSRDFGRVVLTLGSERGKVHTVDYCRPVTTGLEFLAWLDIDGLGEDAYVRFGFDLSWHPAGQHHVIFNLTDPPLEAPVVLGDTTVVIEVDATRTRGRIALSIERAAAELPNGDDNTLSVAYIEIGARRGRAIAVAIDSLAFRSKLPAGEHQYEVVERLGARYDSDYGITQYTGVEIGLFHTPRLPHMNAYFPDSTQNAASVMLDRSMKRDKWVEAVHVLGGLVSLNHPFGASLRPRRKTGADFPSGLSVRDLSKQGETVDDNDFWRVAKPILEDDGLGADILEVGYLFRGIGSLEDHLRLWDLAVANGIDLVGNGASDTHGGAWGPDMIPNPLASWVWAEGKGRDQLLRALKAGRVAFGDPFLWTSSFAFGVGPVMMGDTLRLAGERDVQGWIHMDPWRSDVDVRLVQIRIKRGRELSVIRRESIEYHRDAIPIRVEEPCFVRMEIYERDGTPLVFSNPVFLIN
jgi:hypothetical protein